MNTMTMANALKAVFGAQTLTTASYFPACAQDGTPSGVISAANLASVLGVRRGTLTKGVTIHINGYGLLYVDVNGGGVDSSFYALKYNGHEKISGSGNGVNITDNGGSHTVTLTGNNGTYLYMPA